MSLRPDRRVVWATCCAFCLLLGVVLADEPEPVTVSVRTDRPEALYKCNEPATFLVSVTEGGKPVTEGEVAVKLTLDYGRLIDQKTLKLEGQPLKLLGTLAEPGFLNCLVTFSKDGKTYRGAGAAGFDPKEIKPACKLPEDFDAFWRAGRDELAKVPLDLKITPKPEFSDDKQDTFYISFANVDNSRMYGFLCVPKGKKGPFPALLFPPSAGLVKPTKPTDVQWAQKGVLYLDMCIHDFDPLNPPAEIGKRLDYTVIGGPDRNKYYFRRAILGLDRAIEYLASRPDFDRKHLVIASGSQGGGLAFILAALNPRVSAICLTKPAMCDWQAPLVGRGVPWPGLLRSTQRRTEEWIRMSEYFDAVNFARKINIPVLVNVGFIDSTCPPSTGYAAYNVIPSANKTMVNLVTQEHFWTFNDEANAWWTLESRWVDGQLGLRPFVPPVQPGTEKPPPAP